MAHSWELSFCRSFSLAKRHPHPLRAPFRAADSSLGTFVCGAGVSERYSFPGTPSPLAPLRPPTRVPGAAGPELPGSSLLPRRSSGQARVRPGPRPRSPPDPRGCCTGYGGRDGGRSLAWAGRGPAGLWVWVGAVRRRKRHPEPKRGASGGQSSLWKPGE